MIPESEWIWQGHAGHFIGADNCRFRLATRVGDYLISTVGDYFPNGVTTPARLGAGDQSFFETCVFKAEGTMACGCAELTDLCEVEGYRFPTANEAQKGHIAFCRKYARSSD